ncbi:diaminobutyrate--2-oxoglutarate transaminase [Fimbriiglobus ruber]|nr:diaminobutyrate--2-oxoglutarate transaminase [Fimbriiglobus ruber]
MPNRYYLDRQRGTESNARSYPRRLPLAIRRARGVYVTDADGREYIDCLAGAGALVLGHNHPVASAAIRRHLDEELPLQTLDLSTPVKDRFVAELFATLPKSFADRARIQFCGPGGADAIEAAIKLVKTATGRRSVFAFHGGYHGQSHGALALTGNLGPKMAVPGLMPDAHFLPFPYTYRCPFGCQACDGVHLSKYVEGILADPESGIAPAAGMFLEPVQGEGGSIPAPEGWLREIRRITKEQGIPLVLDEVQTGWGRTGKMYAFEHAGITPDVLILSKAIGGGLPLSVVVYDQDLDVWQPGAHAGTFRGNQLAMSTGLATLRYVREHDLPTHAGRMGERLRSRLEDARRRHPYVGDVRGKGLMIGVEFVDPAKSDHWGRPVHDGAAAGRVQRACLSKGLIVEVGGRYGSVIRLLPPLIVSEAEVDLIADRLIASLDAAEGE